MTQLETQFDVNLTEPEAADAGMARALEEELRQLDGELELEQHARGLVGSSRSDDGARGGNGRRSLRGAAARGATGPAGVGAVAAQGEVVSKRAPQSTSTCCAARTAACRAGFHLPHR